MNWWMPYFSCIPFDISDGSKKTQKRLNKCRDDVTFMAEFARKLNDALDRYHFEGLPDTVSERALKQSLIFHGCFWIGETNIPQVGRGLIALPFVPSQMPNIYGDYPQGFIYSVNGLVTGQVKAYIKGSDDIAFLDTGSPEADAVGKGVVVWENMARMPFITYIIYYAQCVADTMRTLDVCRSNLKNPFIIACEENQRSSVERFLEQRASNYNAIMTTGVFDVDKVKTLPIDLSGTNLQDIVELAEWYEAKWRELCGIDNNSAIDKRGENLIQAELSVNDQYTDRMLDKSIDYMQEALDDANRLFGLSIRVIKNREEREDVNDAGMDNSKSDSNDISGSDTGRAEANN